MGFWIFLAGLILVIGVGLWAFVGLILKAPIEIQLAFSGAGIMIMGGVIIEIEKWRKKNK